MVDKGIPSDSTNVSANYLRTLSPEELKRMEENREILNKIQNGEIREAMKKLAETKEGPVEQTGYQVPADGAGKNLDISNIKDFIDKLGEKEVKPVPLARPNIKPTIIDGREVKPVPLLEPKFKTKSFDGTGNEAKPEPLPPTDGERTVEIYGKKYKIKTVDGPFQMNVGARDVVIDGKTIHLAPNETIEFLSNDTY